MTYDKPKVTIDLEEYNSLLDEKNRIIGDEYVVMAKSVIATLLNSQLNPAAAVEALKRQGIIFTVNTNIGMGGSITPNDISIIKVKDNPIK